MSRHPGARPTLLLAASILVLVAGACDATTATPTLPDSSPLVAASQTEPAVASPTKKVTAPTVTPPATPTAPVGSPGADATPTAAVSLGPGAVCSGTDDNKKYWSQAASQLTFDVYCPVLPAGWYLIGSSFDTKNGGTLTATYTGKAGASIEINEGRFCTSGLSACSAHDVVLGTAKFGDRAGSLDTLGPALGYAIYIDPGSVPSWSITGTGLTQDAFVSIAAALVKVPKS